MQEKLSKKSFFLEKVLIFQKKSLFFLKMLLIFFIISDGSEYEKRAEVMIKQAEQFEIYGVHLKGKLTQVRPRFSYHSL